MKSSEYINATNSSLLLFQVISFEEIQKVAFDCNLK